VAWARSYGAAAVVLDVAVGNTTAHRLYERCGFAATGESAALESDPTADTIRMRRDLNRPTHT
jgi:ribosomal protein S18 acetylase RimI-like enzyme